MKHSLFAAGLAVGLGAAVCALAQGFPQMVGGRDDGGVAHTFNTDSTGDIFLSTFSPLGVAPTLPSGAAQPQMVGGRDSAGAAHTFNTDTAGNLIVSGGGTAPTTGPLTLFVDGTNGSDSNPCTASGTSACKTIQGAVNKIPKLIQDPVTVSVAAGSYAAGAYVSGFTFAVGNYTPTAARSPSLSIQGTLTTPTLASGVTSGAVASSTQGGFGASFGGTDASVWGTMTVTGAGWTVNNLAKLLVKITGGTGAGQIMRIESNTATAITVDGFWRWPPDSTSTFSILQQGTTITGGLPNPNGATGYSSISAGGFSSTHTSSFFVSGVNGPGWASSSQFVGNLNGLGNLGLDNSGFPDSEVDISQFAFNGGAANGAVGVAGPVFFSFRFNDVTQQQHGVSARGPDQTTWIEGNYFDAAHEDESHLIHQETWGEGGQTAGMAYVWGNYVTTTTGSFNSNGMFAGSANWLQFTQNHCDTVYDCEFISAGSSAISMGNHFSGNTNPIRATRGVTSTPNLAIGVDADVCASASGACLRMTNFGAQAIFTGTAMTGTGSAVLVQALDGARVEFATPTTATSTTSDLQIDGVNYSLATLRSASPKIIQDISGTLVFED